MAQMGHLGMPIATEQAGPKSRPSTRGGSGTEAGQVRASLGYERDIPSVQRRLADGRCSAARCMQTPVGSTSCVSDLLTWHLV